MPTVTVDFTMIAAGMTTGARVHQEVEVGSDTGDVRCRGRVSQHQVVVDEHNVGQLRWCSD